MSLHFVSSFTGWKNYHSLSSLGVQFRMSNQDGDEISNKGSVSSQLLRHSITEAPQLWRHCFALVQGFMDRQQFGSC